MALSPEDHKEQDATECEPVRMLTHTHTIYSVSSSLLL